MDRKQDRADESRKKNKEGEEHEEWPRIPPGYKILVSDRTEFGEISVFLCFRASRNRKAK